MTRKLLPQNLALLCVRFLSGGAALAGLLLTGCHNAASPPASTGMGGAAPVGTQTMLAFVTNNPSAYWTICRKGTEAAAKELNAAKEPGNVNVQFVMPADGTAATQKQDVDDLLTKGVKGIAISPVDPANQTQYLNTVAAKTSLITSDSDAPLSHRLCYIGTDNIAAGKMAGGLIKQALPQGGKIVLFVGKSDAQNAKERIEGIRQALQGSKVTVLDVRTDDTDHARAKANAADALVKTADIAGMVGIWSYNGPAILSAVEDAGKVGKVAIVCFDQETDTLNGIKKGAIAGTVVQDPYSFGYQSVKMLSALARGDKSSVPASGLVIVPTKIVNKANLNAYEADQVKKMGN